MKSLHLDLITQNHTSSRVGDSGYMSFQGLPCTTLTQHNVLELSSQIADTEIGAHSDITHSDIDDQTEVFVKDSVKDSNYGPSSPIYDKKISLYDPPSVYNKSDSYGPSVGNIKLIETRINSNSIDESAMSIVSSNWGDERQLDLNWEVPSAQLLEHLSNAEKGSHRSEVQLR